MSHPENRVQFDFQNIDYREFISVSKQGNPLGTMLECHFNTTDSFGNTINIHTL